MKFAYLPNDTLAKRSHYNYNGDRGYALGLVENPNTDRTKFYITKSMLPKANSAYKDITISAVFICDNRSINNSPLIDEFVRNFDSTNIKQTEIEVHYHNKMSLNIDWIRIENERAKDLFSGIHDTKDSNGYSYKYGIQHFIDFCASSNSYKFYRLYANGGHDGGIIWHWGAIRYTNILTGGLMTSSMPMFPEINYQSFLDYTKLEDSWTAHNAFRGVGLYALAKPYYKPLSNDIGTEIDNVIGQRSQSGFINNSLQRDSVLHRSDSLNSFYETSMYSATVQPDNLVQPLLNLRIKKTKDSNDVRQILGLCAASFAPLVHEEVYNYGNNFNSSYLYGDKPWWTQIFTTSGWWQKKQVGDTTTSRASTFWHPLTGDETSYMISKSLILGTKGLCYDREASENHLRIFQPGTKTASTEDLKGFTWYDEHDSLSLRATSLSDIINTDSSGGDFLDRNNDRLDLYKWLDTNKIKTLLTPSMDRVYLGFKSMQKSAYKLHSFIRNNESFLMGLKLQCYYGQGFLSMYHQNPSYTESNIMNKYILKDSIRTRKLFQPNQNGTYDTQITYEDRDSSFYDVTILKNDTNSMQKNFIVGAQNRRCDPLIINLNTTNSSQHEVQFYSYAEFEKAIQQDTTKDLYGVKHHKSWWKDKYWKKFGAREITIPFNFKLQSDPNKYCLLHVKEMYDTSAYAVNLRNVSNTKLIDTVIGQDSPLALKLQPGQGTFLSVKVLPPGELTGKLDNINQNKMVSMPVILNDTNTNKVIHYATYYKEGVDGVKRVYLAVSQPTLKNELNANIVWYSPINISDTALLRTDFITPKYVNKDTTFYNSYHPSIVVRQNGNNHKVYVSYSLLYPIPYKTSGLSAIYIMESVYNINISTLSASPSKVYNQEIGHVLTDGNDYGTPTVNSAKDKLFYAWSGLDDSLLIPSIFYSYKTPSQSGVNGIKSIRNLNNLFSDCTDSTKLLHPSLNTYSTTFTHYGYDNYATLVWEQTSCYNGTTAPTSQIYMTYLDYYDPTSTFGHFLPSLYLQSRHTSMLQFYDSNNIVKFKNGVVDKFPSVYSNIMLNNFFAATQKSYDYITFESSYLWGNGVKVLPILSYDYYDHAWDLGSDLLIYDWKVFSNPPVNLVQPSIKQPSSLVTDVHWKPTTMARVNLNFKMNNSNNEIYQFIINEGSKFGYDNESTNIFYDNSYVYNLSLIANNVDQNHLSASPSINYEPNTYKNRRIFQTGSDYLTLRTSARYFYKKNANDLEVEGYIGYKTDTTKYYIANIYKDNADLTMILPFTKVIDTTYGNRVVYNNNDSIYSTWFNVGSSSQLSFKLFGQNTSNSELFIERQDSTYIYPISVSTINSDSTSRQVNVLLINGMSKNYRFVMRRIDTLGIYDEIVAINGIPTADTVNYKTNKTNAKIIDLSNGTGFSSDKISMIVHPTPASDEVYVKATIPFNLMNEYEDRAMVLKVYSPTGILLDEFETYSGSTIGINTKNYLTGIYLLKIDMKESRDNSTAVYSKIVIQK